METKIKQLSSVSSSEDDEIDLLRMTLGRVGVLKGGETPAQLRAAYVTYRSDSDAAMEREAAQRAENAKRAMLDGLRRQLSEAGISAADIADGDLQPRLDLVVAERNKRREQAVRDDAIKHRERQANHLFSKSKCPAYHASKVEELAGSNNAEWAKIRDTLVEQAKYARGFLVALLGPRGGGKTQIAASVARACCDRLMTVRYVKALDLFRDFRRAYTPVARGQSGESETDIIAEWVEFDLLVIDELHQRGDSAWENNTLINLLDLRYDEQKCTVLIANQTKDEFAAAMGDSVVSRIHETGEPFMCNWPSYRKPGNWRQKDGAPLRRASGEPRPSSGAY